MDEPATPIAVFGTRCGRRRAKADAASSRLGEINSTIQVDPLVIDVTADNIRGLLDGVHLVIDAATTLRSGFS